MDGNIFESGKKKISVWKGPNVYSKTLDSNDQNQVADQRVSLKQWFAGGAQSRGLRKPGCGHCYLRFFTYIGSLSKNDDGDGCENVT